MNRRESMECCVTDAVHLYGGLAGDWVERLRGLLESRIHVVDPPYTESELEEMSGLCRLREGDVSEIVLYQPERRG